MCVILALSFISVLISLLSFSGVRATVTILNRGVTTTTVVTNTPPGDQPSLTRNSNGVAAARSNAISITTAATKRSVGNSTSGGSSSINNSATDDDGMIELNTAEFDNELRRMVEERRKDGTQRGKIAWLMRYVRVYNSRDGCAILLYEVECCRHLFPKTSSQPFFFLYASPPTTAHNTNTAFQTVVHHSPPYLSD